MATHRSYPASDGFYMPAEYAPQQAVVMIWPFRTGSWGRDQSRAQKAFFTVARAISRFEKVIMIAPESYEAVGTLESLKGVAEIIRIDSDDSWARDIAPTFVINDNGDVRGINWKFNAWGGEVDGLYTSWEKDDSLAPALCAKLGFDCYDAGDFVLEGGAIHSDGEGTVMVTEACLLSKGRNPSMTKQQIEDKLKNYLGAKKILWLPRGIYMDETNEHVDNICAFIRPGEVVLAWTDDTGDPQYPLSLESYRYLSAQTDAKGRSLVIHKLPIPDIPVCVTERECGNYEFAPGEDIRTPGERLAASYVNFLFVNGAAIVPVFGNGNESSDERALGILRSLCPEREIIPVYARDILLGGGNIHCITQQIPKGACRIK